MNREKIKLSEHLLRSLLDQGYEDYDENEDLEFEFIEENETYSDLEKGYEDYEVIIKRISDNKYFKFEYSQSPYHSIFDEALGGLPSVAHEVFPKTIKQIIYE
jgi:hypothetical protein